jgi:hypothetical protein
MVVPPWTYSPPPQLTIVPIAVPPELDLDATTKHDCVFEKRSCRYSQSDASAYCKAVQRAPTQNRDSVRRAAWGDYFSAAALYRRGVCRDENVLSAIALDCRTTGCTENVLDCDAVDGRLARDPINVLSAALIDNRVRGRAKIILSAAINHGACSAAVDVLNTAIVDGV